MRGRGIEADPAAATVTADAADRRVVEETVRQSDEERRSEVSCMAGEAGARRLDEAWLQGRAEEVLQVAQKQRDIPARSQLDQDNRQQRPQTSPGRAIDGRRREEDGGEVCGRC